MKKRMSDIGNKEVMAENLRYYLELSGKTQKEIAEIIGVPTSTFNNWMKGLKYPRIDKIEMLSNYFGILKSDLIEKKNKDRREMQQSNATLADIIIRAQRDSKFAEVLQLVNKLDEEKLSSILALLK